ncbi:MAG: hypothetical protein VX871_10480 [Pseudomonadota bacterium]|nr:hypothetical protein [Pseudomonadota bacterium]
MRRLALVISVVFCSTGAFAEQDPVQDLCGKKVSALGNPQHIESIASLQAVELWIEQAKAQGDNMAMWHNAHNASIRCEKMKHSEMYRCFASGRPCPTVLEIPAQDSSR